MTGAVASRSRKTCASHRSGACQEHRVTADSDGFYYRARRLVEITGDEEVGLAATAQSAMASLKIRSRSN
jgi:hypothetical protein